MGCRPIDLPRPWDSIYNFRQSVEDGATVPLYYENRIPELQLTNEDLNNDMQTIIEAATLDDEQERTLERQCAREYQLIVRDDRLEKIAEDLVQHFLGRVTKLDEQGKATKAMMVAIDRFTAVRMHDKVRKYWAQALDHLKVQLTPDLDELEQRRLRRRIQYMEETDMAVVVSSSQGEIEDFENRGLAWIIHEG